MHYREIDIAKVVKSKDKETGVKMAQIIWQGQKPTSAICGSVYVLVMCRMGSAELIVLSTNSPFLS